MLQLHNHTQKKKKENKNKKKTFKKTDMAVKKDIARTIS